MSDVDLPHLQWPVRLAGRSLAVVEQDTLEDVSQCVEVILSTPQGAFAPDPDLGRSGLAYAEGGVEPEDIVDAVGRSEPRADIEVEAATDPQALAQGRDRASVKLRLRGDQVG